MKHYTEIMKYATKTNGPADRLLEEYCKRVATCNKVKSHKSRSFKVALASANLTENKMFRLNDNGEYIIL